MQHENTRSNVMTTPCLLGACCGVEGIRGGYLSNLVIIMSLARCDTEAFNWAIQPCLLCLTVNSCAITKAVEGRSCCLCLTCVLSSYCSTSKLDEPAQHTSKE